MAQTAAHLVDHVIPPVPVRQWVISVPKRLRGMLADRPAAVAALTKIFLDEIERLLCAAAGGTSDAATPASSRPRLGGICFLHRFGSALNHHVHLHACVTDGPRSHDTSLIAWAKLMARVGEEFPLECPNCGGDIRLIAFITETGPIRKVLTHLGEPLEPPPVSPARGPPTDWGELVQIHDDRDVVQASPDELPVIDIHSL
jgi:hypothetical protein